MASDRGWQVSTRLFIKIPVAVGSLSLKSCTHLYDEIHTSSLIISTAFFEAVSAEWTRHQVLSRIKIILVLSVHMSQLTSIFRLMQSQLVNTKMERRVAKVADMKDILKSRNRVAYLIIKVGSNNVSQIDDRNERPVLNL